MHAFVWRWLLIGHWPLRSSASPFLSLHRRCHSEPLSAALTSLPLPIGKTDSWQKAWMKRLRFKLFVYQVSPGPPLSQHGDLVFFAQKTEHFCISFRLLKIVSKQWWNKMLYIKCQIKEKRKTKQNQNVILSI